MALRLDYLIGVSVYIGLMFIIAWYGQRKTKNLKDYYIAGGKLGRWVGAFTYQATNLSASAFMGAAGLVYASGLGPEFWIGFAFPIGIALAFIFLFGPMRRLSEKVGALTLPEFFGERFHSGAVRIIATILIVVFLLPLLIAQYTGAGHIFQEFLGVPYQVAVIITGLVVALYVSYGGFFGVAYTDFVQGLIMIFAALIIPPVMIGAVGGFSGMFAQFSAAMPPAAMGYWGTWGPIACIGVFVSILMGCFGVPHTVIRFFTIKKGEGGKVMAIAMGIYIIAVPLMLMAGVAGRVLYPDLPRADMVIPRAVVDLLPPALGIVVLSGFLAAIMSTTDSIVLVCSSSFARDIYQRTINPRASERRMMWIARIVTFVVGIAGMIYALYPPALITVMMSWTWGLFGVVYSINLILGLYWKRMSREAALTALIVGPALIGLQTQLKLLGNLNAVAFSLIFLVPLVLIVAYLSPKPPERVIKTFFG